MQTTVLLRNVGVPNSHEIDTYIGRGGYQALRDALEEHQPADIIRIVLDSGLDRWFSAFLATWKLEPPTHQGEPVDAWMVYTARFHMRLSTLQLTVFRAMTDRIFVPGE